MLEFSIRICTPAGSCEHRCEHALNLGGYELLVYQMFVMGAQVRDGCVQSRVAATCSYVSHTLTSLAWGIV